MESVYENYLIIELHKAGLKAEQQKEINVYYYDELVGDFKADIIVEDMVIVELKSVKRLIQAHEVQLVNYLVATSRPVGLLLNFGERGVEVTRKVKDLKQI